MDDYGYWIYSEALESTSVGTVYEVDILEVDWNNIIYRVRPKPKAPAIVEIFLRSVYRRMNRNGEQTEQNTAGADEPVPSAGQNLRNGDASDEHRMAVGREGGIPTGEQTE